MLSNYSDADTLPKDVLCPDFAQTSCVVDRDDIFATSSIKDYWLGGFPKLDRPSDELE